MFSAAVLSACCISISVPGTGASWMQAAGTMAPCNLEFNLCYWGCCLSRASNVLKVGACHPHQVMVNKPRSFTEVTSNGVAESFWNAAAKNQLKYVKIE
jgi:hypothetical protein